MEWEKEKKPSPSFLLLRDGMIYEGRPQLKFSYGKAARGGPTGSKISIGVIFGTTWAQITGLRESPSKAVAEVMLHRPRLNPGAGLKHIFGREFHSSRKAHFPAYSVFSLEVCNQPCFSFAANRRRS